MIELYHMGGSLFMGGLTLILTTILAVTVYQVFLIRKKDNSKLSPDIIKSLGLFALVTGCLGQFIGLYSAFTAIEEMGKVSQSILAGGLKVSSITTIYGMLIFLISYLIWLSLTAMKTKYSTG